MIVQLFRVCVIVCYNTDQGRRHGGPVLTMTTTPNKGQATSMATAFPFINNFKKSVWYNKYTSQIFDYSLVESTMNVYRVDHLSPFFIHLSYVIWLIYGWLMEWIKCDLQAGWHFKLTHTLLSVNNESCRLIEILSDVLFIFKGDCSDWQYESSSEIWEVCSRLLPSTNPLRSKVVILVPVLYSLRPVLYCMYWGLYCIVFIEDCIVLYLSVPILILLRTNTIFIESNKSIFFVGLYKSREGWREGGGNILMYNLFIQTIFRNFNVVLTLWSFLCFVVGN